MISDLLATHSALPALCLTHTIDHRPAIDISGDLFLPLPKLAAQRGINRVQLVVSNRAPGADAHCQPRSVLKREYILAVMAVRLAIHDNRSLALDAFSRKASHAILPQMK
jgi:hypothetical protein